MFSLPCMPSDTAGGSALILTHTLFPQKSWKFPQSRVQADAQNVLHPIMIHLSIKDLKLQPDVTLEETDTEIIVRCSLE